MRTKSTRKVTKLRSLLVILLLLTGAAYPSEKPMYKYWVFRGFGLDLVECQLIESKTRNCHFLTGQPHPLDGVMEAIHRAIREKE